uniref:PEP-CTERM protein-sorting domain-containing protein n=1 Tax=Rhodopseudomonas palustris (strain BisA53) TaxID=316055 RepID=Q07SM0_RHOP5
MTGLGAEPSYPDQSYDRLLITGYSGSFSTPTASIKLNDIRFDVGYNAWTPQDPKVYSFSENLTIDGITGTLTIPFAIQISYTDTLEIAALSPQFNVGNYLVTITPLLIENKGNGSYGKELFALVQAQVGSVSSTPLPAALPMMISGLAGIGFVNWRRKRKHATHNSDTSMKS